jgi:alpha-N-arabinofuranosidase
MRNLSLRVSIVLVLMFILFNTKISIAQTTYTINTNKILHTIDERIYGHFLEHIYHSVNGGLWGELVWNRSFERLAGTSGMWSIEDSVVVQSSLSENVRLLFGETDWQDYEYNLQAQKIDGNEGFLIIFRANGENFYWCNLGGWANVYHAIEKGTPGVRWSVFGGQQISGTIETGRWYDIRIRCDSNHFQVWLDENKIFDFTDNSAHLSGQVGIGTWVTKSSYKNMVVTSIPDGDTLFKGLPSIGEDVEVSLSNWEEFGTPELYSSGEALNSNICVKIINEQAEEAGIQQHSFNFINQAYYGSFWARGVSPEGFKVSLLSGSDVLAQQDFSAPGPDWQEYAFQMNPGTETTNGTLRITLNDTGTVYMDQINLMGQDAIDNDGFRPDLYQAIEALEPPVIRWPGGYFAELYRWKSGIGPQHERVIYPIEAWNDQDVNSFGTDEFITLCQQLNCEPVIVINIGHRSSATPQAEYIEEAQHWVEYCNGPASSTWGAVRAANGHEEPYNVKYWEISNEVWLTRDVYTYIDFLNEFVPALKAVDPTIKIIACGSGGFNQTWNSILLSQCADIIDYISTHHYEEIEYYRSGVVSYENFLITLGNNIASSSNPDIRIYMSEWNVWSPIDLRCGLYAAGMLNVFERQGKNFKIGGPALFLRHSSAGTSWNNAFINFNNYAWFPAPNYVVMKLWHDHFAPNYIETTGSNSDLNVVSTLSADSNEMYFKVVNTSNNDVDVILDIDTSFFPGNAYLEQITASSLYSTNSFASPDNIRVKKGAISIDQQQVYFTSPKYSAAVVTVDQYPPVGIDDKDIDKQIKGLQLYQNNPNPFSSRTIIKYDLDKTEHVMLRVLDLSGRIVTVLVNEKQGPGRYQAEWIAKDDDGNDLSNGLYFYELNTPSNRIEKKMILIR